MQTLLFPAKRGFTMSALALCVAGAAIAVAPAPALAQSTPSLEKGMALILGDTSRSEANRARDQYRHPLQTLAFFGVRPDSSLIEITPGGGWYAEILAPLLKAQGQYIAANVSSTGVAEKNVEANNKRNAAQKAKFDADPAHYGKVKTVEFSPKAANLGPDNSVDFVVTFRNVHNWVDAGTQESMFKAMFAVLKPGGVLGVVDHRAPKGKALKEALQTGYLPEDYVIGLVEKAGFKLDASSEVNANPKDTKDYAEGVWTLPPVLALKDKDRARYVAIGESDRFTLRFVKPLPAK